MSSHSLPSELIAEHSKANESEVPTGNWLYRTFSKGRTLIPIEGRNLYFVFFLIGNATLLDAMSSSAMLTSLIDIQVKFDSNYTTVSWVLSSYAITMAGFIMVFGRMGDIIGHHLVFLGGVWVFTITSLICAVIEREIVALIVFRAIQGIAASASIPSSYALMAHYFSGPKLTRAITILTLCMTSAFGAGTILGGAFGETKLGYAGFFYLSFGLGMISSIFGYFYIIPVPPSTKNGSINTLNYPGAVLLVTGFILVILGLTEGGDNWNSPKSYIPLPVGILLVVAVLIWERFYIHPYQVRVRNLSEHKSDKETAIKKEEEEEEEEHDTECNASADVSGQEDLSWKATVDLLIPAETWAVPNLILLVSAAFLNNASFFGSIVSIVQYYAYVEQNSNILAAVKILPFTIVLIIGSAIYRDHIAQRIGKKWVAAAGVSLCLVGNVLMSRMDYRDPNNYWKFIFTGQIIYGYGANLFFILYLNLVIANTPLRLQGIVTGVCQAIQQTGTAVVLGAISSILGNLDSDIGELELHRRFKHSYYFLIAISGVELILILFLRNSPKVASNPTEPGESTGQTTESTV